ncbi:MAG: signal peptidase I [Blautia sp.]|nr:signal peptidase I [Blautia sp.]
MLSRICKTAFFIFPAAGIVILVLFLYGYQSYVILSGSMEPAIPTGSLVITDTRHQSPEPGEIITYQAGENCITHRVVAVMDGQVITRGDANDGADPFPVRNSQIIGIVRASIPLVGYLIMILKKRWGACLLILLLSYAVAKMSAARLHKTLPVSKG